MNQQIKITSEIWTNLEYTLANEMLRESFTNKNLNKSEKLGDIIYHYTSLTNFLAIIQSQSFFCTNLNYLNDKKEYKFGVEQVLKVVDKLNIENFANYILNDFENDIHKFYNSERYVVCFSKEGDLLSQWRAYANQGKGIAIGFDLINFEDSIHQHVKGCQIMYDETYQLISIEEIIKMTINYYEGIKHNFDWNDYGFENLVRNSIISSLHHIVSTYKSEGFKEEKEFRYEYCIDGNMIKKDVKKIHFRATDNLLIPYIILESDYINFKKKNKKNVDNETELTFKNKKLPIKEIIIGPSLDFELTKMAIEDLLNKLNYNNIKIKKSIIPYRI